MKDEVKPKEYCDCKETKRFKQDDGGVLCLWYTNVNNELRCYVCELPVKTIKAEPPI